MAGSPATTRSTTREIARLGARLMAHDLRAVGINVDCVPVLDVPVAGAHDVIGDRAYGRDPETVALLGRAAAEGLIAGGVLPGRSSTFPATAAPPPTATTTCRSSRRSRDELERAGFRALPAPRRHAARDDGACRLHGARPRAPGDDLARRSCGTSSAAHIGYDGLVMSDDVSMNALSGSLAERARAAFAAGCDVVLHCNGRLDEMEAVASDSARACRRGAGAGPPRRSPGSGTSPSR